MRHRLGDVTSQRNRASGRLQADDPAEGRGNAHGPRNVGPDLQWREAGREGGGGSAARTAGRADGVARVVRPAEDRVVGLEVAEVAGDVGLADDDRARGSEAGSDDTISAGGTSGRIRIADDRGKTRHPVRVL